MLTEQSTIEEITSMFNRMDELTHVFYHSKLIRGQTERARLHGQEVVFHYTKLHGQPVGIFHVVRAKSWFPFIYLGEGNQRTTCFQMVNCNHRKTTIFLRPHAVERYVQRYQFHDEKHVVTPDEFNAAISHILKSITALSLCYDSVTQAWFLNVDGGSFLCLTDKRKKILMVMTYLTASKMKLNQRIANGSSMHETEQMKRDFDIAAMRRHAKENTIADFIASYIKRKESKKGKDIPSPR